jgi:hypothetical protein
MRHFGILLVLLAAGQVAAQNYEAAVKRRLNEQHNDAFDKVSVLWVFQHYFSDGLASSVGRFSVASPDQLSSNVRSEQI